MNTQQIADELILLKKRADHDTLIQDYLSKAEIPGVEYVKPERSGRRNGYFRKRPARNSPKQAQHRLNFSTIANNHFGEKGVTVLNDGRVITKAAEAIGDELRGTGCIRDPKEKERENLIKILRSGEVTRRIVQLSWI